MKKFIKNNLKTVTAFIIGGVIFGGATLVLAAIGASQVTYTNNGQTTVQGALDTLYTRASKWVNPNDMGTPTNYIFDGPNKPTTTSSTTPPSGKNVYLGLYADSQYGVCIKRNGTQHCFRYNNWVAEAKHVQEVFSDISCGVGSDSVRCDASDCSCYVNSAGYVRCTDSVADSFCYVLPDGTVTCS